VWRGGSAPLRRKSKMKRIEVIITPWSLDDFKDEATRLNISEFDVVEVYRAGCAVGEGRPQLYRGREFKSDLRPRLRVEFVLFDDAVQSILHELLDVLHPESIAVFKLDQEVRAISATNGHLTSTFPYQERASTPQRAPQPQIIGFIPRNDASQLQQTPVHSSSDTPPAFTGGR